MEQKIQPSVKVNQAQGSSRATIDRKNNLVLTLADEDNNTHKVFVPEPTKISFESVIKVLQRFYTLAVNNTIPADVIVRDYAEIIKEIFDADDTISINKVHSFIDRSLSGATIFTADGKFVPYAECEWSDEVKCIVEGTLLFTSALYRYVPIQARKVILKDITTSLPLTEWKTSCLNSYKEQQAQAEEAQEAVEG